MDIIFLTGDLAPWKTPVDQETKLIPSTVAENSPQKMSSNTRNHGSLNPELQCIQFLEANSVGSDAKFLVLWISEQNSDRQ